jgi:type II secretory pathway component PulM
MQTHRRIECAALIVLAVIFAGCGEPKKEREARERARLEREQQAERAIEKSIEAVNEVSKKLGRKPPALDLGLPAEKKPETAPATTAQKP